MVIKVRPGFFKDYEGILKRYLKIDAAGFAKKVKIQKMAQSLATLSYIS